MLLSRAIEMNYCDLKKHHKLTCETGDEDIKAFKMCPLLDLVNHKPLPLKYRGQHIGPIRILEDGTSSVMLADRDFKPGQEIFWNQHGLFRTPNIELLYGGGFVIDKNLDEYFTLHLTDEVCDYKNIPDKCKFEVNSYEINDFFLYKVRCLFYKYTVNKEIPENIGNYLTYYKSLPKTNKNPKHESRIDFYESFFFYH